MAKIRHNHSRSQEEKAPLALLPANWEQLRSVVVLLRNLPHEVTTWDLWRNLERYGHIVYIEMDDGHGAERRTGRVRFEPPPNDKSFLLRRGPFKLDLGSRRGWCEAPLQVEVARSLDGAIRSPSGSSCPDLVLVAVEVLGFGVRPGPSPNTVMEKRRVGAETIGSGESWPGVSADFVRSKLVVSFVMRLAGEAQPTRFRMVIKFRALGGGTTRVFREELDGGRLAVVLLLNEPPLVSRRVRRRGDAATHAADRLTWAENDAWFRTVRVGHDPQTALSLEDQSTGIDFGRWIVYRLELGAAARATWDVVEFGLRDRNIRTGTRAWQLVPPAEPGLWDMLECGTADTGTSNAETLALLASGEARIALRFDVRYQLEVCVSREILSEYSITRAFLRKLAALGERGRLVLEYAADAGKRIWQPMDLFGDAAAMGYHPRLAHMPDHCVLVRKVVVTPTRIYFHTPVVEMTNRVLRHFRHVQDKFLRVQFTDEHSRGSVLSSACDRDNYVFVRFFEVLHHGLRMGRWHWEFLAAGSSQLRDHGAFFFCRPDDSLTCERIRAWMGRFGNILNVAKYNARLGQCFSTTRLVRGLTVPCLTHGPDRHVTTAGRTYCFTDGVGCMSRVVAELVADEWKLGRPPSAIQFRMGGCKGVLVAWPEMRGTCVMIRASQNKFEAVFNGLEVVRCSRFAAATLNRQIITVLSSLGVPDHVFTEMTRDQLANYEQAMTDPAKARQLLQLHTDEAQTTLVMDQMVAAGFAAAGEPFVCALLQLWKTWSMRALKEKARVVVDQGAFLLGGVDEYGVLRGWSRGKRDPAHLPQIFLQVADAAGEYHAVTGLCVIGRNPSLHPGDLRVVEAVDDVRLRHIRDLVLFPQRGDRDVPSMCAGGDLDGDDYFVLWDPRLLPPAAAWFHLPMENAPPSPPSPAEPAPTPTLTQLKTFFVEHMKNNALPLIAHAHLGQADQQPAGAKSRVCLELAHLHARAVDYAKTGLPAVFNPRSQPRCWPHWMEKAGRATHSVTALGQMYDLVDRPDFVPNLDRPFDRRILARFCPVDAGLLCSARRLKSLYDAALRRTMVQLELANEFELFTSFVLSRPRIGSAYKQQESVAKLSASLRHQFAAACVAAAGGREPATLDVFVAAMYQVTDEEVRIALAERRHRRCPPSPRAMPLISFPWLFVPNLARIVNEAGDAPPPGPGGSLNEPLVTRTADGRIIHRGEILSLFPDDDEIDNEADDQAGAANSLNLLDHHEDSGVRPDGGRDDDKVATTSVPNTSRPHDDEERLTTSFSFSPAAAFEEDVSGQDASDCESEKVDFGKDAGSALARLRKLIGE